tara:strand:+ start:244 stop:510 length:267 start_codon:yes stop_codon:yes gene_type:complete
MQMSDPTDRWVPMAGLTKLVYNVPLDGGEYVKEKLIASKVTDIDAKVMGAVTIATSQKDGSINVISSSLILKRLSGEQNLKYGITRWR